MRELNRRSFIGLAFSGLAATIIPFSLLGSTEPAPDVDVDGGYRVPPEFRDDLMCFMREFHPEAIRNAYRRLPYYINGRA